MLTREQAYEGYLDKYKEEINNMICKANEEHKTYINIGLGKPKEIIEELKNLKYNVEEFTPAPITLASGKILHLPRCYKISWDKNK